MSDDRNYMATIQSDLVPPYLNPDKAFQYKKIISADELPEVVLEDNWISAACRTFSGIDVHLNNSAYKGHENLKKSMKFLYAIYTDKLKLPDVEVNESLKAVIKQKIEEETHNCTEGFHIRVSSVLGLFFVPKTPMELLQRVRQSIVLNHAHTTCQHLKNNVHGINNVLYQAKQRGYGIDCPSEFDPKYGNTWYPNGSARRDADDAISESYTVLNILNKLSEETRGVLISSYAYRGQLEDESYDVGDYQAFRKYISELLGKNYTDQEFLTFDESYTNIIDIQWPLILKDLWSQINDVFALPKDIHQSLDAIYGYVEGEELEWSTIAPVMQLVSSDKDIKALLAISSSLPVELQAKMLSVFLATHTDYEIFPFLEIFCLQPGGFAAVANAFRTESQPPIFQRIENNVTKFGRDGVPALLAYFKNSRIDKNLIDKLLLLPAERLFEILSSPYGDQTLLQAIISAPNIRTDRYTSKELDILKLRKRDLGKIFKLLPELLSTSQLKELCFSRDLINSALQIDTPTVGDALVFLSKVERDIQFEQLVTGVPPALFSLLTHIERNNSDELLKQLRLLNREEHLNRDERLNRQEFLKRQDLLNRQELLKQLNEVMSGFDVTQRAELFEVVSRTKGQEFQLALRHLIFNNQLSDEHVATFLSYVPPVYLSILMHDIGADLGRELTPNSEMYSSCLNRLPLHAAAQFLQLNVYKKSYFSGSTHSVIYHQVRDDSQTLSMLRRLNKFDTDTQQSIGLSMIEKEYSLLSTLLRTHKGDINAQHLKFIKHLPDKQRRKLLEKVIESDVSCEHSDLILPLVFSCPPIERDRLLFSTSVNVSFFSSTSYWRQLMNTPKGQLGLRLQLRFMDKTDRESILEKMTLADDYLIQIFKAGSFDNVGALLTSFKFITQFNQVNAALNAGIDHAHIFTYQQIMRDWPVRETWELLGVVPKHAENSLAQIMIESHPRNTYYWEKWQETLQGEGGDFAAELDKLLAPPLDMSRLLALREQGTSKSEYENFIAFMQTHFGARSKFMVLHGMLTAYQKSEEIDEILNILDAWPLEQVLELLAEPLQPGEDRWFEKILKTHPERLADVFQFIKDKAGDIPLELESYLDPKVVPEAVFANEAVLTQVFDILWLGQPSKRAACIHWALQLYLDPAVKQRLLSRIKSELSPETKAALFSFDDETESAFHYLLTQGNSLNNDFWLPMLSELSDEVLYSLLQTESYLPEYDTRQPASNTALEHLAQQGDPLLFELYQMVEKRMPSEMQAHILERINYSFSQEALKNAFEKTTLELEHIIKFFPLSEQIELITQTMLDVDTIASPDIQARYLEFISLLKTGLVSPEDKNFWFALLVSLEQGGEPLFMRLIRLRPDVYTAMWIEALSEQKTATKIHYLSAHENYDHKSFYKFISDNYPAQEHVVGEMLQSLPIYEWKALFGSLNVAFSHLYAKSGDQPEVLQAFIDGVEPEELPELLLRSAQMRQVITRAIREHNKEEITTVLQVLQKLGSIPDNNLEKTRSIWQLLTQEPSIFAHRALFGIAMQLIEKLIPSQQQTLLSRINLRLLRLKSEVNDGDINYLQTLVALKISLLDFKHKIETLDNARSINVLRPLTERLNQLYGACVNDISEASPAELDAAVQALKQELLSPNVQAEINRHRGLKKGLVNVLSFFALLGVGYLVGCCVNYFVTGGKHFFFHPQTETARMSDLLVEKMDHSLTAIPVQS